MKKFLCLLLSILLLCLPLTACKGHIEDTNGEDPSLTTLTDADIVKTITSSVTSTLLRNKINNKTTIKVGKLSGVTQLEALRFSDNTTLTYTATLLSGNLRICLVDVDAGKIVEELIIDGQEHNLTLTGSGEYSLRAAGESAKLEFTMVTNARTMGGNE